MTSFMNAVKGAGIALVASLVSALVFAYLFRLPIPLGGIIGPFGQFSSYDMGVLAVLKSVAIAWVFYGIFGGFVLLVLCGAFTGIIAGKKYSGTANRKNMMIALWSAGTSVIPVFILSILDYLIGPW